MTDSRDGKSYKTITIGNQIWMAENLNYNAKNSVCDSCSIFGRFYIWSDNEKYCPTDWHIPSEDEWQILLDAAGGEEIAGFHLKFIEGWSGYGGIDSLGFNGLPSGYHHSFVGESYNGLTKTITVLLTGIFHQKTSGKNFWMSQAVKKSQDSI